MTILFVHNARTTFVDIDYKLLSEEWDLEELYLEKPQKINPFGVFNAVRRSQMVFAWFASWHSLLPVLFAKWLGKPSILVIGGYDTANVPEADYGSQRGGMRKWLSRLVIQSASYLLVNSYAAKEEAIHNAAAPPERITVVYHGIVPFDIDTYIQRASPPMVVTVGGVRETNLYRKGLMPFVQAAAHLPDVQFKVIGKFFDDSINTLRAAATPNVTFTGFVSDDDLYRLYQQTSVYVQASLHEGFGMSLAEAMYAGCVPVVTRVGSLPEVVGETGLFVESNNPVEITNAVREALDDPEKRGEAAAARVRQKFNLMQRRNNLYQLIQRALDENSLSS